MVGECDDGRKVVLGEFGPGHVEDSPGFALKHERSIHGACRSHVPDQFSHERLYRSGNELRKNLTGVVDIQSFAFTDYLPVGLHLIEIDRRKLPPANRWSVWLSGTNRGLWNSFVHWR